jgi:hypothetical protein
VDVLDGAAEKRCADDAVGNLGRLLRALLGLHVQQGQVDVALEMWPEPWCEVCALD